MDDLKQIDTLGALFEKWNAEKMPFEAFQKKIEKMMDAYKEGVVPAYADDYQDAVKKQEALMACYKEGTIKEICEVLAKYKDDGAKYDHVNKTIRSYLRKYEDGWDKKKEELKRRQATF